MYQNNKNLSLVLFGIFFTFALCSVSVLYLSLDSFKENKIQKIEEKMAFIYTNADRVSKMEGGLKQPGNDGSVNKIVSELTGETVYNMDKEKSYSVHEEKGKVYVHYGIGEKKRIYPIEKKQSNVAMNKEDIKNEDLYTYNIQNGKAIVTGFSENGYKFITTDTVVKIPSSYRGNTVVEIADSAFYQKNIMSKVIIPDTVRKIGPNSFSMNGAKGNSFSINKPYTGTWTLNGREWVKQ